MAVMENCVDIARPFVDILYDCGLEKDVQLIGGIGSAALGQEGIEILPEDRLIVVRGDLYVPQYRDDGNLRDLDVLVKSVHDDDINDIELLAEDTIDEGALELSIFGFRPISQLDEQSLHPARSLATVNVSDRYVEQEGFRVTAAKKALFPFAVGLPVDTLETWWLQVGKSDFHIPVPHPGTTILNYLTRSVSGLRPKDTKKLHSLARNVADTSPEIIDWIIDGPGASQLELARILHTLREPRRHARPLDVGRIGVLLVKPYDLGSLIEHEAFMLSGRPDLLKGLVELEHAKSAGMHKLERNQRVVTAWQKHVEPRIQGILQNK